MGRENSISDSEGRSVTPDLEDEGIQTMSPTFDAHSPTFGNVHHDNGNIHALGTPLALKKSIVSHRSRAAHSRNITSTNTPYSPWQRLSPIDKFRAAVRKVMAMRRGTLLLGVAGSRAVGSEPGVDPSRPECDVAYGHIYRECEIEIVDYSAVRHTSRKLSNLEFVDMMDDDTTWKAQPWTRVRWINIAGLSWDVIKALASRYPLHPLALEDVFHGHACNRSKADYYSKHLFLRVLRHELSDKAAPDADFIIGGHVRSQSPDTLEGEESDDRSFHSKDNEGSIRSIGGSRRSTTMRRRRPLLPSALNDLPNGMSKQTSQNFSTALGQLLNAQGQKKVEQEKREKADAFLESLKEPGQRVNVKVSPMFMFLYRDGTVITLQNAPDLHFTAPIALRLQARDTVLRKSVDPSLLIHAFLDIIVDQALGVIDEYHKKISKFERKILMRPNMKTVRALHILDGDLILHKRTLDPIKTMIFGLRRYDLDRCAALVDMSDPANKDAKVVGYMSHKAKIYLADVYDHMDYILTSLDMFAGIAENLIDYTFNVASYEMNEVMRRLTLATIIFLPLTLLTGYFGMNFEFMWSVHGRSDVLFWQICLPLMALVIPMFMWRDILGGVRYVRKRIAGRKAVYDDD